MTAAASHTRPWWERYVGLPFGEAPREVTCWGLVVLIYGRELGIELPVYGEISARDLGRIARAMKAGADDGWRVPAVPAAFDVVLMRSPSGGSSVIHVGVMIDGTRMIHAEEASDTVIVPVTHWSVANRITGYRRRAA